MTDPARVNGNLYSWPSITCVVDGEVIGGVGLSGGNGEQDIACGLAALEALAALLVPSGKTVLVEADIKK